MNILIPMDFTEVSNNAFKYAYAMFPKDDLYCLHVAADPLDEYEPVILKQRLKEVNILKDRLSGIILKELNKKEWPGRIHVIIEDGEIIKAIKKNADEINPSYIVMGRRDKYDLIDKWLGTYSLSVIKTLDYPVLVIPRFATFMGFKKIIVATDKHLKDRSSIDWIKNWNLKYKAFIKFLSITFDKDKISEQEFDQISEGLIGSLFEEDDPSFGFEIERINSKDVVSPLLAKAYNYHADLIIALPEKQSVLVSLLVKSVSKELILESKLPILFCRPE